MRHYEFEMLVPIRIRYYETDKMGVVHHSNYFRYFELARMEQFRSWGSSYEEIERSGGLLMVADMQCRCRAPAYFDEMVQVKVSVDKMTRYRILHHYEISREDKQIIAVGTTNLVSVSKEGIPVPLPDALWNVWQMMKGRIHK